MRWSRKNGGGKEQQLQTLNHNPESWDGEDSGILPGHPLTPAGGGPIQRVERSKRLSPNFQRKPKPSENFTKKRGATPSQRRDFSDCAVLDSGREDLARASVEVRIKEVL
jgi:hypothetical protein